MATRQEVEDGNLNRIDADALDVEKLNLIDLQANGSDFNLIISANAGSTEVFNLARVLGALRTADTDVIVTTFVSDMDAAIAAAIGTSDIDAVTIRKAVADAIVAYDVNITAT